MKHKQLLAVSLFTGAGGLDLGVEWGGFTVRVQVEKDRWCVQTLRANQRFFGTLAVVHADVRQLTPYAVLEAGNLRVGEVDLLIAGPPCQSFSTAGNRKGLLDPRGQLVYEFLRFLSGIQPRLFLFENVPGFVHIKTHDGASLLDWFLKECSSAGYSVSWKVLDCADYGVPQRRKRLFVLGDREGYAPQFPEPTHVNNHLTLRDALDGLDEEKYGLGGMRYGPKSCYILKHVPPGCYWRDLPEQVRMEIIGSEFASKSNKTGFWRRLSWDRPSPTIIAKIDHRSSCLCHPDETRPLTVREAARVQTFPDEYTFEGPVSRKYRQIGEAVPPKMAHALALSLASHLDKASSGFAG